MDTSTFVDGIGRRLRMVDSTGDEVETLRLCRELSEAASTEAALIERAGRLAGFAHPSFSQVLRVERVRGALGGLSIISKAVPGVRLSDALALAQRKWLPPDLGASLYLLEQIASALAAFHGHSREFAHGALGPERIVIRPDGHPIIVEHVLAPAIWQLQMGRALLWSEFRVPVPAVAGTARMDQMTDLMQLGMLALALVLGRPIRREEYPQKLQDLLAEATSPGAPGVRAAASLPLHGWILRLLQPGSRSAFRTAADAFAALEAIVAEQPRHKVSPASVTAYVAACQSADNPSPAAAETAGTIDLAPVAETRARGNAAAGADRTPTTRVSPAPSARTDRAAEQAPLPACRPTDTGKRGQVPAAGRTEPAARERSRLSNLDWSSVRRAARVSIVTLGLAALFGVTYLGARGYLGLPDFIDGHGTLVVESRPSGVALYVDGLPSGQTPATLELRAGEHTIALRSGRGTTLVPVMVVSGARRVERVEIRQRRQGAGRPASQAPFQAPPPPSESASGRPPEATRK